MIIKIRHIDRKNGQTSMELAVFGAILIFVIGAIVRQALTSSYQQNQSLKAMRIALSRSFFYSEGIFGKNPDGELSRNLATVLIIEDRLTSDSAKFAPTDRIPLAYSGSAMHARNLFMPINRVPEETYHLNIFDIYINGKHFPLRTAGFKKVCFEKEKDSCVGAFDYWYGDSFPNAADWKKFGWSPNCEGNPNATSGCAILYTAIPNSSSRADSRWCNTDEPLPPTEVGGILCSSTNNLPADGTGTLLGRFDLNQDGVNSDVPKYVNFNGNDTFFRKDFGWQWYGVLAYRESKDFAVGRFQGIKLPEPKGDDQESRNTQVNIDQDITDESIVKIEGVSPGPIKMAWVVDSDFGDLDGNQRESSTGEETGILKEMQIYTTTGDGSFLKVEEGKLYNSNNQFVRNIQKKDQFEIIERQIQLTRNTGRFCVGPGKPPELLDGGPERNPIDLCVADDGECFGNNTNKTCMSLASNIIYVRSTPIDKRGRKWITDISNDNYAEFAVPKN